MYCYKKNRNIKQCNFNLVWKYFLLRWASLQEIQGEELNPDLTPPIPRADPTHFRPLIPNPTTNPTYLHPLDLGPTPPLDLISNDDEIRKRQFESSDSFQSGRICQC